MKQGWEIKRLGDVCNVLNGLWIGKKEPFINICVIRNTNFTKDCKLNLDNVAYIDAEAKQFASRKLLVGDIIVEKSGGSEKQPVGRVVLFDIVGGDYSFSNFTSALRVKDGVDVIPKYLHRCLYAHYLRGETYKLQSKTTGLHNLDMKGYLRLPIPVPPIAEQEKIVAELDCLSGIIEKKKQQLKELDALAQSIFYEMFGDPIENDKGWEVKKLGDICSLKAGKAIKANELSDVASDNLYPCFGGNGIRGYIEKVSHHNQYPIIGRQGALCGNVVLSTKEFYATEHAVVVQPVVEMNIHWSYYTLMYMNLNRLAQGVAQPGLSVGRVNQEDFIFPPLALQHDFASKIEAIEKQKELIAQSIKETETLFNSRMDYYFN